MSQGSVFWSEYSLQKYLFNPRQSKSVCHEYQKNKLFYLRTLDAFQRDSRNNFVSSFNRAKAQVRVAVAVSSKVRHDNV